MHYQKMQINGLVFIEKSDGIVQDFADDTGQFMKEWRQLVWNLSSVYNGFLNLDP